jgi:cytoskeletal protein RodZ
MESIGQFLKSKREAKGTTLEEIAQATHINKRFLIAIELEEFEKLPGDIFVKGFIKTYAQYIDLDTNEIMETYRERFEKKEPEKIVEKDIRFKSLPVETSTRPNKFLPVGIAFLVLVGVSYLFSDYAMKSTNVSLDQKKEKQEKMSSSVSDKAKTSGEQENGLVGHNDESGQEILMGEGGKKSETEAVATGAVNRDKKEAVAGSRREEKPAQEGAALMGSKPVLEVPATEELMLKMAADSDSWMLIKIDNETMKRDFILKAGEAVTFKALKDFSITTGNATGVRLYLNGKEISWPKKDAIIHDFIISKPKE